MVKLKFKAPVVFEYEMTLDDCEPVYRIANDLDSAADSIYHRVKEDLLHHIRQNIKPAEIIVDDEQVIKIVLDIK